MESVKRAPENLTFVVRLWREHGAGGLESWPGRIECIGLNQVAFVRDLGELVPFIEGCIQSTPLTQKQEESADDPVGGQPGVNR